MSDTPIDHKGIIARAVEATPTWVWALCGAQVVTTVCLVALIQLTGFAAPLQRIVNAQAQTIENAADRIDSSTLRIETITGEHSSRISALEGRVARIEDTHERLGVK